MLMVISEKFTKLTKVVPLRSTEAYDVAVAIVEHWVYKYGAPKLVVSDNVPKLVARLFQIACKLLGTKTTTITAFHPQTNGQVNRYNRSLLAMLRHYVGEYQGDLDTIILYAYVTVRIHGDVRIQHVDSSFNRSDTIRTDAQSSTTTFCATTLHWQENTG